MNLLGYNIGSSLPDQELTRENLSQFQQCLFTQLKNQMRIRQWTELREQQEDMGFQIKNRLDELVR